MNVFILLHPVRRLTVAQGKLITSTGVVLVVLALIFVVPGVFLMIIEVASHYGY